MGEADKRSITNDHVSKGIIWVSIDDIEISDSDIKDSDENIIKFMVWYCKLLISRCSLNRVPAPVVRVVSEEVDEEQNAPSDFCSPNCNKSKYSCLRGWFVVLAARELYEENKDAKWKKIPVLIYEDDRDFDDALRYQDETYKQNNVILNAVPNDEKGLVYIKLKSAVECMCSSRGGQFKVRARDMIEGMLDVNGLIISCTTLRRCAESLKEKSKNDWSSESQEARALEALFGLDYLDGSPRESTTGAYNKGSFLSDVYMDEKRYMQLRSILLRNKNVILQGAPGVGKTFAARRLAWSIMGEKDDSRIELIQFHQSYSYEDFVMGWRPKGDTFELRNGAFVRFCEKARSQSDKEFFLIIDEINRGNLSKIFGELLALIEVDYRGYEVDLVYSGERFSVPRNLHIIGMMNTADRSLAMIDYALRRRFKFFDMDPGFDADGFVEYCKSLDNDTMNELIKKIKELNGEISNDRSLGKGFCVGHSYFCGMMAGENIEERCREVVEFDILPMLREYWFDDEEKVTNWANALREVLSSDRG